MFKWAKQPGRKFATINPFADLPAPGGATIKRDRYLSPDEIRQVWRALDEPGRFNVSGDAATALRLILVTAARPGMVRGMVGSELRDLSGPSEHGPHWSLPGQRMKAGSAFITPLSGLALELLRPHLKTDASAPMFDLQPNDLYEAAHRIVAALGMKRWTPHDLRRTAATILDKAGYSLEQIGALLAHTRTIHRVVRAAIIQWTFHDTILGYSGSDSSTVFGSFTWNTSTHTPIDWNISLSAHGSIPLITVTPSSANAEFIVEPTRLIFRDDSSLLVFYEPRMRFLSPGAIANLDFPTPSAVPGAICGRGCVDDDLRGILDHCFGNCGTLGTGRYFITGTLLSNDVRRGRRRPRAHRRCWPARSDLGGRWTAWLVATAKTSRCLSRSRWV